MEACREAWLHEDTLLKESEPVIPVLVFGDGDNFALGEVCLEAMERVVGEYAGLWVIDAYAFSIVA